MKPRTSLLERFLVADGGKPTNVALGTQVRQPFSIHVEYLPYSLAKHRRVSMKTMTYEDIARLCHAVNKAYCESLGDSTQDEWHYAPQWQKDSAIRGVEYHLINKNVSPQESHASWMREKERDGWKHGPVKNVEKKEHPCMVPYEELSQEQRSKDFLFKSVCDFFKEEFCR